MLAGTIEGRLCSPLVGACGHLLPKGRRQDEAVCLHTYWQARMPYGRSRGCFPRQRFEAQTHSGGAATRQAKWLLCKRFLGAGRFRGACQQAEGSPWNTQACSNYTQATPVRALLVGQELPASQRLSTWSRKPRCTVDSDSGAFYEATAAMAEHCIATASVGSDESYVWTCLSAGLAPCLM